MILGIDLDDTITDIRDEMYYYASIFDKEINGNGIVNKNTYFLGEKYNWSKENKELFFHKYRTKIVDKAKVRDDVIETFNYLRNNNYKIYIITARSNKYYGDSYKYTYEWLNKNNIPFDKLIIDSDKYKACLENKVNIFIDDQVNNLDDVSKIDNIKLFIMDNIDNYSDKYERIYNFKDLINKI